MLWIALFSQRDLPADWNGWRDGKLSSAVLMWGENQELLKLNVTQRKRSLEAVIAFATTKTFADEESYIATWTGARECVGVNCVMCANEGTSES